MKNEFTTKEKLEMNVGNLMELTTKLTHQLSKMQVGMEYITDNINNGEVIDNMTDELLGMDMGLFDAKITRSRMDGSLNEVLNLVGGMDDE